MLGLGVISQAGLAQKSRVHNLPKFDRRPIHFGFMVGFNTADAFVQLKPDFTFQDSLLGIRHISQPGFNIQPLLDLHLTKSLGLRLTPGLSFQERALEYAWLNTDSSTTFEEKRIESTYLEFPLLLKYRTNRINNFASYVVAGGKFGIDMASTEDVDNATSLDKIIKTVRDDYSAEMGFGFDFFLTYFKFGIELRFAAGLPNIFIDDDTVISRPIESIRTRTWLLSFTFEG